MVHGHFLIQIFIYIFCSNYELLTMNYIIAPCTAYQTANKTKANSAKWAIIPDLSLTSARLKVTTISSANSKNIKLTKPNAAPLAIENCLVAKTVTSAGPATMAVTP